jgi:hypothetical protein
VACASTRARCSFVEKLKKLDAFKKVEDEFAVQTQTGGQGARLRAARALSPLSSIAHRRRAQ